MPYDSTKPSMADADFPTSFANIRENQRAALAGEVPPSGGNGQTAVVASLLNSAASVAESGTLVAATVLGSLYRVSYYLTVSRAATTSSAVQITVACNDGIFAFTKSGPNLNTNVVTSDSGSFVIGSWATGPITYATTYTSVGATTMQYILEITVEKIR